MTNRTVVVIGGGVIGLSLAWELIRRGCDVTVVDRGPLARETSWTAAGILPPANLQTSTDPLDRLRGLSHQLYPVWAEQLFEATSIDVGLRRCGGWYLADSNGEHAAMFGMRSYWEELSIQCEAIPLEELARREPALLAWSENPNGKSAWWVPDEYQIRPPRLLSALIQACRDRGAQLIPETEVVEITKTGPGITVSTEQGNEYQADDVVVCSGAWSGKIATGLQLEHSLIPVRGQILLLKTPHPLIKSVVNVGNRYVIARDDGYTLVGSCEEEVGFLKETHPDVIDGLNEFAISILPSLADAEPIDAWSGLRPMTFDGFPMIGPVPGREHVYVAAGHYRSGIHLAPGTAVALADQMLGSSQDTPASKSIHLDSFRVGKQQNHSTVQTQ